jgi:SAM-dependent methyltransferase
MNNQTKITKCEVCENEELISVLDLGLHPICDDLIDVKSSQINEEFPIDIYYCEKCFTAHQAYQIPKKRLFPKSYHYRARFTKDVLDGMESLVNYIENNFSKLDGKKVIDIGCNDGSLLDFFKKSGAITSGVEPTDAAIEALEKGHQIIHDYFGSEIIHLLDKPDVITFTNVFAHIEDLNSLIAALKKLLKKDTLLVIENHYLGGVLDKMQFDTFYHEHPRTYSYNSFIYIAKKLELDILSVEFPSRYGGNIRVVMGNNKLYKEVNYNKDEILKFESNFSQKFLQMNDFIEKWKVEKKQAILDLINAHGKIVAKAFPARAALPIKLLGLNENHIECVFEKPGSPKIGHFVPGTRIPIRSDEELLQQIEKYNVILNNAWHISTEIEKYLRNVGFSGKIINII